MWERKLEQEKKNKFVSAVVVAAGSSSRMGGIDKLFYPLGGVPVLVHTLLAFQQCDEFSEIVVVCRQEKISQLYSLLREYSLDKVGQIVAGADTRQGSVFRGITACSTKAQYFAVHDGARPLVTSTVIRRCLAQAVNHGAATAALPCKDTLKRADENGKICQTVDRTGLYRVQTPQIFEAGLYFKAMHTALETQHDYTDDCQLIEALGHPVFLSEGHEFNFKLTTPDDLLIAEAILRQRADGETV